MSKTEKFHDMLTEPGPILLGGVYDGLSARLAEEAGFDALWASGFSISTSRGIADVGLLTMTELLDVTRQINQASNLPVIADVDDGFGDAVNVDRMVRLFEDAGIAGICIEDNRHPKRNSLTSDLRCQLVSAEEFVGKLQAARAASQDPRFVIIARVEALIAGLSMEEALHRAEAYARAGASMIVIHSKDATVERVREFALRWTLQTPLVAIPTTYSNVSLAELYAYGFKMAIFANQGLRAAIKGMREAYQTLTTRQIIDSAGDQICALDDVFQLAGFDAVRRIESRFVHSSGSPVDDLAAEIARQQNQQSKTAEIP